MAEGSKGGRCLERGSACSPAGARPASPSVLNLPASHALRNSIVADSMSGWLGWHPAAHAGHLLLFSAQSSPMAHLPEPPSEDCKTVNGETGNLTICICPTHPSRRRKNFREHSVLELCGSHCFGKSPNRPPLFVQTTVKFQKLRKQHRAIQ